MGHKLLFYIGSLATLALVSGCGGGGGGSSANSSSFFSLSVTDAPIGTDVTNVFVQFHGVELHGPEGTVTINFSSPKQIDLLAQTGNVAAPLVTNAELSAGQYQW